MVEWKGGDASWCLDETEMVEVALEDAEFDAVAQRRAEARVFDELKVGDVRVCEQEPVHIL